MSSVLVYVVIICSAVTGMSGAPQSDCSYISGILSKKNVSSSPTEIPLHGSRICGDSSRCCSPSEEALLKRTVMSDVSHLLEHNFHSVHNVLSTSSDSLAHVLEEMVERSRNKTMHIFLEVYEKMGSLADGPVAELYNALWSYLQRGLRYPPEIPPVVPSADGPYLESLVIKFFSEMFPLVYHQAIHPKADDFNDNFKSCLKNNVMEIKPFAKIPETMAKDVAASFEATKVLLESLSLGMEGISRTNKLIERTTNGSDSCREALLRLHHCPKCQGLKSSVKPCNGYCLNVLRGCLTQLRVTDLDLPWSNFLSETLDLVKEMRTLKIPSIDKVLERMYIPVSDAIMVGSLEGPRIQRELNSLCGRIAVGREDGAENSVHPPPSREVSVTVSSASDGDVSPFWRELDNLRDATDRSKVSGFYANLAEVLCSDDSFAETRDTSDCWNGYRIGEYTKELVRPGLDAQKYNPEMKWTPPAAVPDVEEMAEKLRHMRQVVASRLSPKWAPEAESQVAYDASGSGDGRGDTDDEGYSDPDDGSGSGDGESRSIVPIAADKGRNNYSQNKPTTVQGTGGCGSLVSTISITLTAAALSLLWTH
uniref:Division abnormally delayed protein n=2 Tax=Lygus hesperus TaxID=30085 RepID=A0A0A9YYZ7_LYGHE